MIWFSTGSNSNAASSGWEQATGSNYWKQKNQTCFLFIAPGKAQVNNGILKFVTSN